MFWAVQQTLLFPLLILSGMLLPLETGPAVDAGGVRVQPAAHVVVEAERALFAGEFLTGAVLAGVLSAAATAAVGLLVGIRVMQRSAD